MSETRDEQIQRISTHTGMEEALIMAALEAGVEEDDIQAAYCGENLIEQGGYYFRVM